MVAGEVVWVFSFRRNLYEAEAADQSENMSSLSMFMATLICTNDSNTRIWRHCPSGVFSVKSFLKASISQSKLAPPGTAAWRGHTPSRMEMFTWFAIERYISTDDNFRHKISPHFNSEICLLCRVEKKRSSPQQCEAFFINSVIQNGLSCSHFLTQNDYNVRPQNL